MSNTVHNVPRKTGGSSQTTKNQPVTTSQLRQKMEKREVTVFMKTLWRRIEIFFYVGLAVLNRQNAPAKLGTEECVFQIGWTVPKLNSWGRRMGLFSK